MNHNDWLIVAFVMALALTAAVMVFGGAGRQHEAAASSMEAVKFQLTPFERDRREALRKAKLAGVEKFVEGEK